MAAASYSRQLSSEPGIVQLTGPAGTWAGGRQLSSAPGIAAQHQEPRGQLVLGGHSSRSPKRAAQSLVGRVRSIAVPDGATSYVGGAAASLVDQKHDLGSRLPLALILIVLTTLIVLWLFTGSSCYRCKPWRV